MKRISLFLIAALLCFSSTPALAQVESGDDAYDPFADYTEFEEASEEEADINFFRNGRFFTLGFALGYRQFTGVLGQINSGGVTYGGFLTYFFDLRFAFQVGYLMSSHNYAFKYGSDNFVGTNTAQGVNFHLKYFLNTQNVTRGLAAVNPYIIGGFSMLARSLAVQNQESIVKTSAAGFDIGGGIEIPLMRHKMFLGAQFIYHIVNFPDENTEIAWENEVGATVSTGTYPRGDAMTAVGILGINF